MESQSAGQQDSIDKETPILTKTVHTTYSYQSGRLDEARVTVVDDLGTSIPQITFEEFLQHLAPPQPKFDLDGTMNILKQDPEGILPSGRWSAFAKDPKHQRKLEKEVFAPLSNIFDKVVDAIVANSDLVTTTSLVQFLHKPGKTPESSGSKQSISRPDGYLALKERSEAEDAIWPNIVLPCEYKNNDAKKCLIDNVMKCLWSMQHIMRDDPRRRAAFAITIENVNTRAWFCCRSSVIVSEPFNFISEPELLVKLFAAFAFADERSLGFDPTIQCDPEHPTQFTFTVQPDHHQVNQRRFRTKSTLSSFGAEPLRGRGTRVFKAIEIDDHGNEKGQDVVLKDTWIDSDRIREGNILAQLDEEAQDNDKTLVEKYFLNTVCHGDVWLNSEDVDDTEKGLTRELKPTAMFSLEDMKGGSTTISDSGLEKLPRTTRLINRRPDTYAHKTHYRIVFKERGTTIDNVNNFRDVLNTLVDAVDALQLLRRLGWVHRDISTGNILRYGGGTKLADLEYAKKADSNKPHHNIRTGTLQFMPVEAAARNYLFRSFNRHSISFLGYMRNFNAQLAGRAPWAYNYLHNLESLWWVAVWIMCYNHFQVSDNLPGLQETKEDLYSAQQLFPPSFNASRMTAFMSSFSSDLCNTSENKKDFIAALDYLRQRLIMEYREVESGLPASINLDASDDTIYDTFKDTFNASRMSRPDYKLTFLPDIHEDLIKGSKREGEEQAGPSSKRRAVTPGI